MLTREQEKEEVLLCGRSFIQLLFLCDGQCSVNTRGPQDPDIRSYALSLSSLLVLLFRHCSSPSGRLLLRVLVGRVVSTVVGRAFLTIHDFSTEKASDWDGQQERRKGKILQSSAASDLIIFVISAFIVISCFVSSGAGGVKPQNCASV